MNAVAGHPDTQRRSLPDVDALLLERATPSGRLRYASPALQFDAVPSDCNVVGTPWGDG